MFVPLGKLTAEEDLRWRSGEIYHGGPSHDHQPSSGDNRHPAAPLGWHGEVVGPCRVAPPPQEVPLPRSLTAAAACSDPSTFKSPTPSASNNTTGTGNSSNGDGTGNSFNSDSGNSNSNSSKPRSPGTGKSSSSRTSGRSSSAESGLSSLGMSSISQPRRTSRPAFTSEPVPASAVMKAMSGQWRGDQGEIYTLLFPHANRWTCICCDSAGVAMVDLLFDEEFGFVWWGKDKAYFVMGAEIVVSNHWARWYAAEDTWARKPRFAWTRLDPSQPKSLSVTSQASPGLPMGQGLPMNQVSRFNLNEFSMPTAETLALQNGEVLEQVCPHAGPSDAAVAEAATRATAEIMQQLVEQGGHGKIWFPQWNQKYRDLLGSLFDFLAAQPDKFTIRAQKDSRRFTVTVADPVAQTVLSATRKCLEKLAVRAVMKQVTAKGEFGVVDMPDWKDTYAAHLGTLRSFLEGRPEFVVIPKRGNKFSLALAESGTGHAKPDGVSA